MRSATLAARQRQIATNTPLPKHVGLTKDRGQWMQNTMQLVYALQKADKQFELMVYPTARHGLTDPAQVKHWYTMMTEYVLRNL